MNFVSRESQCFPRRTTAVINFTHHVINDLNIIVKQSYIILLDTVCVVNVHDDVDHQQQFS